MAKSEGTHNAYPVYAGPHIQFIPGVPAVPQLGITEKDARALIRTGAFTDDPAGWEAAQAVEPPRKRRAEPPPDEPAATNPQTRPTGGSSDSKET